MGLIITKNNWAPRYIIITDSNVSKLYGERVVTMLREMDLRVDMIDFPAGEVSKNIQTSLQIVDRMIDLRNGEQGFEVFYEAALTPWLHLTPDLQVIEPGPSDNDTAVILGLLLLIDF